MPRAQATCPNSPQGRHGVKYHRENGTRALMKSWLREQHLHRVGLQTRQSREGHTVWGERRLRGCSKAEGALEETQGGFWLRQKQNFKGNRNCGSFKDPLQDQLTPTNVYLSSHFMMALHWMGAQPHPRNSCFSQKDWAGVRPNSGQRQTPNTQGSVFTDLLTIIKKIKNYNNKTMKKPYLYNNKM